MDDIAALTGHAVALRHDLHRHPELMYHEERTAGVVRGELDRLGIPWRACADTGTARRPRLQALAAATSRCAPISTPCRSPSSPGCPGRAPSPAACTRMRP